MLQVQTPALGDADTAGSGRYGGWCRSKYGGYGVQGRLERRADDRELGTPDIFGRPQGVVPCWSVTAILSALA